MFSDKAKYLAHKFEVGSNKLVIYGSPIPMIARSQLLARIDDWSCTVPLATSAELNGDNLPAFVLAWLMANGMNTNTIYYSVMEMLQAWEFCNYLMMDANYLVTQIEDRIDRHAIDDKCKVMLTKLYKSRLDTVINDFGTDESNQIFQVLSVYFSVLAIDKKSIPEIMLINAGPDNLAEYLTNTLKSRPLTKFEINFTKYNYDMHSKKIKEGSGYDRPSKRDVMIVDSLKKFVTDITGNQ